MREPTRATNTMPGGRFVSGPTAREDAEPIDAEVLAFREQFEGCSPLDELVREGAQRMLQTAIDAEVDGFIARRAAAPAISPASGTTPTHPTSNGGGWSACSSKT